jgi:hypothetical protein
LGNNLGQEGLAKRDWPLHSSRNTTKLSLERRFCRGNVVSSRRLADTPHRLINVLKAANQSVPEELLKFGTTVKKRGHDAYGAFYKETDGVKTATKITFDD